MTRSGRRPGPGSTQPEILDAARALFADRGFERTTIRAVAARAGVNPAMVHHFFGTKHDLLVAALELPIPPAYLADALTSRSGQAGPEFVRRVLALWDEPMIRARMQALIRVGISHERAAAALRDVFTTQLLRVLAERMSEPHAELRAALIGSQMAGLALLRFVIPIDVLAQADHETIIAAVGPTVQRYLTARWDRSGQRSQSDVDGRRRG
jgi:AcrR family transcriptional regulator